MIASSSSFEQKPPATNWSMKRWKNAASIGPPSEAMPSNFSGLLDASAMPPIAPIETPPSTRYVVRIFAGGVTGGGSTGFGHAAKNKAAAAAANGRRRTGNS